MKIKKLGLLTMLGSAAIIGLGSATWVFSGTATKGTEGSVSLATCTTVGDVKLADDPKFVFNVDKETLSFTVDITPTYTATGATATDIASVTKTYDVSFGTAFDTYFTFTNLTGNSWTSGTKITSTSVSASWKSNKNPTTKTDYETMKTALTSTTATDNKITVTFKATSVNS